MHSKGLALEAIRKKLVGKKLSYREIYAIMDEISDRHFDEVLTTYFTASGYAEGFTNKELYYLTKAMVETGEKLDFKQRIIADKHSVGGIPGSRTSLIVVPIVAAAGFTIPKSSSRAITTPAGTADVMEVLAPVEFSKDEIYRIVDKTKACIIWGGSFNIAPADDLIIQVEKPLLFESYDKIIVSIMAKKIAFNSNHVVIDLPYGETSKIHSLHDIRIVEKKFRYIARKFNVKIKIIVHKADEPQTRSIGPLFEAKEALKVLEQKTDRSLRLETLSLNLAANLLDICLADSSKRGKAYVKKYFGNSHGWAYEILRSGAALKKMREIIDVQGGNAHIKSDDLTPGKFSSVVKADKPGKVRKINIQNLTTLARLLGAPAQKKAGIVMNKSLGDSFEKEEILFVLYSEKAYNLKEAKDSVPHFPIINS